MAEPEDRRPGAQRQPGVQQRPAARDRLQLDRAARAFQRGRHDLGDPLDARDVLARAVDGHEARGQIDDGVELGRDQIGIGGRVAHVSNGRAGSSRRVNAR